MTVTFDEHYMRIALQLAASVEGQTSPNPLVGAVIVKEDRIVGQGAHLAAGGPHAEIHALRMAGAKARGATLYVTLEPCSHFGRTPPCADALIDAGVGRVVVACEDANPQVAGRGIARIREAGIEVEVGLFAKEARRLNEAFNCWIKNQRPLVVWKTAATLDGYIATETGNSRYVTGVEARRRVHQLRRQLPAIIVGIQTVLADDPQLTLRPHLTSEELSMRSVPGNSRQPLRVIFDSQLRIPTTARLLSEPGKTVIYCTDSADDSRIRAVEETNPGNVEVVQLPSRDGRVPLSAALENLGHRGVNGVLLEGGSTLVSQFIRQQLIDKLVYFIAPKLLGGGLPVLDGLGLQFMRDAFDIVDVRYEQLGDDLCVEGHITYSKGGETTSVYGTR